MNKNKTRSWFFEKYWLGRWNSKTLTILIIKNLVEIANKQCVLCTNESALTPGDPVSEWWMQCPVLNNPAQLLGTYVYSSS